MFQCPSCGHPQERAQVNKGVFWVCPRCGGRLAGLGLLRKTANPSEIQGFWRKVRRRDTVDEGRTLRCPICTNPMQAVAPVPELPTLDVCKNCQLFWLDPGEFEQLSPPSQAPRDPTRPPARDPFAIQEMNPTWEWAFFLLGLPLETHAPKVQRFPLATWVIAALVVVISVLGFADQRLALDYLALKPAKVWDTGGYTLLTCFFVHAGWLHLAGNMYFLIVFGDNVEDYLGRWWYVLLLVLATLMGSLVHWAINPHATVPCVGASGGVSGIIAFYALRFRQAQILLLFRIIPLRISVWLWFLFWVCLQSFFLYLQVRHVSQVSAAAHLGGVAVGVLFWAIDAELRKAQGDHP